MRLLFVADGRSPIAQNWIHYFSGLGWEIHLVSTFSFRPQIPLAGYYHVPVAFSGAKRAGDHMGRQAAKGIWGAWAVPLRTRLRQWLGPATVAGAAQQLAEILEQIKPDLVHAMRIPYEGMLAAAADPQAPLIVSVWGNDFTLHARANPWMGRLTRQTMSGTNALHTDCYRDAQLAKVWSFAEKKPVTVLPSGGGVQPEIFYPPQHDPETITITNPRGFRAYVRNDTFFQAIPLILQRIPQARFLCPAMQGQAKAQQWLEKLGITEQVELLPALPRPQMAEVFRKSQVITSITNHDGTPNTLLEALACGCFPVAGNIESIREWIRDGENGLLVDPGNAAGLAQAVIRTVEDGRLRAAAREKNLRLIQERAVYTQVMAQAQEFYNQVAGRR